jgi:hypothetical protein
MPFFSLPKANEAVAALLRDLNTRPFKKLPGSRQSLFESLDRPALRPLPSQPYEYAEWRRARVNIDYHVEVDRHYYSVPYTLVKQQLELVSEGQASGSPPRWSNYCSRANASPATDAPTSKGAIPQ